MNTEIGAFAEIVLFLVGAVLFLSITLLLGKMIRPNRPNAEKNTSYESGEEPVGNAWAMFNPRYYVIAIVFLLFEVEVLFIFPWATVFGNESYMTQTNKTWAWLSINEMFLFIGILILGLVYVWKKGLLDWQSINTKFLENSSEFKNDLYRKVNEKYINYKTTNEQSFRQ